MHCNRDNSTKNEDARNALWFSICLLRLQVGAIDLRHLPQMICSDWMQGTPFRGCQSFGQKIKIRTYQSSSQRCVGIQQTTQVVTMLTRKFQPEQCRKRAQLI
jgi:hypothetical protein